MITVYGLKNCDTCRKARKWLQERQIEHRFHDVRADGVNGEIITTWAEALDWEKLLNRRGTTWRGLPDSDKQDLDQAAAIALMTAHPALVKRPVFDISGKFALGFDDAVKAQLKGDRT